MNAILKEEPPELSGAEINFAPAIGHVVRHCLEKNREERFQSAKDLAFDLERISSISGSSPALVASPGRKRWLAPAIAAAVVVIAAFVGWQVGHRAPALKSSLPARTFTLMTNQSGVEEFPSLAPDGRTFVYVSRASGNADIYFKRVDGRNAINLTKDSPADDTMPAFSPDGSQIAFRSEREGGGIFLMGATGESVRRLTDFGFNPAWSPDGLEIAVSTQNIELAPHSRPGLAAMEIVTVRNGSRREIVPVEHDGVQPSWSPHGDRIAFWTVLGAGGQRDLFTVDPHAADPKKTIVRLTSDRPLEWNPVWSPDGKYLYFGSDRDGTMNLWRIPMDEHHGTALGPPEPLPLPTRFAAHFTIARNGELAYAGVDLSESISRVPFDPVSLRITGEPTPILGGAMQVLLFQGGNVSPDGKWLAFSSLGTREDLFLARTDGSEVRQLTDDPEKDRGSSWAPDGKLLYFYSQRGSRYEVWSIRVDGSGLRQVSHTTGPSLWRPRLMPDGRSLYMFNGNGTVLLPLNPDGTATRIEPLPPMPDPKKPFQTPALSPDGKRFAGGTGQPEGGVPGLWLYELETKRYEQLTADRGFYPQWLPDGKRLLFIDNGKPAMIDVATKQIRPIPFGRKLRGFELTPDSHALILYERTYEADIWLVTSR
jgi:Tol biopolymer transport system component